ncbi:MAG: hypothetical protein F6J94_02820 [Moorea sp. SIO1F2]|uniref:hypothetical protein n=1 Tax=Moorena sp. SIO1F2 TaxID=2607819 RepID=UPI0013BA78A9|nr:hypothetical protein [Moorena sp. SIO1F2]NET80946.1 hypothetical protein [Moorena sp. SIO1F2]
MLVLKIFIVSICATRTLREQRSAVSRQPSAKGSCYGNSLFYSKAPIALRACCANSSVAQALAFGHAVRTTL